MQRASLTHHCIDEGFRTGTRIVEFGLFAEFGLTANARGNDLKFPRVFRKRHSRRDRRRRVREQSPRPRREGQILN